ncbi:hypothetical protein [Streptomyces sp. CC224B]|uniref:hypothetical protein n=1 Tax=Streptomyces sp. CC224B TaxID=3044571 RepID=UPI0024A9195A|nr:hypothetical protein [Streptomyces sp. CC224B]
MNFDTGESEVYQGQTGVMHYEGRFADRAPVPEGCFPVRSVAVFQLDEPDYGALLALSM